MVLRQEYTRSVEILKFHEYNLKGKNSRISDNYYQMQNSTCCLFFCMMTTDVTSMCACMHVCVYFVLQKIVLASLCSLETVPLQTVSEQFIDSQILPSVVLSGLWVTTSQHLTRMH